MKRRVAGSIVGALVLLACPGALAGSPAALDSGVIRLGKPSSDAADAQDAPAAEAAPAMGARRAFDVEAFDGRFESLWFQRKAYQSGGRDEDAARQSDLIREFVVEEGVHRLEIPAASLILESRALMREGSYDHALASLSLAESLDPGRPQIAVARAHALYASGAGVLPAGAEWLRAGRLAVLDAVRDRVQIHGLALSAIAIALVATALFSALIAARYQLLLRHDVEEWLIRADREAWAKAGGWTVLWLPLILWITAGWIVPYWFVAFFRYMRRGERALTVLLLAAVAAAVPAYRYSVGLYGLSADPTVRTALAAANGGYDPDRIVKLRALVDAHPDDPMFRFLLAGLYKNGRYFEDAFREYKRVLEAAPATYQARINLGNIYFQLGQYGQAITNYRQAIDSHGSCLAYFNMYLAQSETFRLKEAAESLAKSREIDPAEANRLLDTGSRESGTPKVVDATIGFDAIWRSSVEGGHPRDWLEGGTRPASWATIAATLANPTSFLALTALAGCLLSLAAFHGHDPARRCTRCGNAFCHACKPGREGQEYCSQCLHLFVLGDGLAPETKNVKLYEVGRYESRTRRVRRLASIVCPGASQVLAGRSGAGFLLIVAWVGAWVGGYPQALAPAERWLGVDIHLAGLAPASIPDAYLIHATLLVAVPLGLLVWLAGQAAPSRVRGA